MYGNLSLNIEHLNESGAFFMATVTEATNKRIVVNYNLDEEDKKIANRISSRLLFMGIFIVLVAILVTCLGTFSYSMESAWSILIFPGIAAIIPFILGTYIRLNNNSNHQLIFNREDNTITYPRSLITSVHVTRPFIAGKKYTANRFGGVQSGIKVRGIPPFNRFPIFQAHKKEEIVNYWAYINHYMQRLTLPPGTAFDAYR